MNAFGPPVWLPRLTLQYSKPPEFLKDEAEIRAMISEMNVAKDGDVNCNPS